MGSRKKGELRGRGRLVGDQRASSPDFVALWGRFRSKRTRNNNHLKVLILLSQENPDGWTRAIIADHTGLPKTTVRDVVRQLVAWDLLAESKKAIREYQITPSGLKIMEGGLEYHLLNPALGGGHARLHGLTIKVEILEQGRGRHWGKVGEWALLDRVKYPRHVHVYSKGVKIHRTPHNLFFYFKELPPSETAMEAEAQAVEIVREISKRWMDQCPGLRLQYKRVQPVMGHCAYVNHPLVEWMEARGISMEYWMDERGEERFRIDHSHGKGELEATHPQKHVGDHLALQEITKDIGRTGIRDLGERTPAAAVDVGDGKADWDGMKGAPEEIKKLSQLVGEVAAAVRDFVASEKAGNEDLRHTVGSLSSRGDVNGKAARWDWDSDITERAS